MMASLQRGLIILKDNFHAANNIKRFGKALNYKRNHSGKDECNN
jgi:hypothetical protein